MAVLWWSASVGSPLGDAWSLATFPVGATPSSNVEPVTASVTFGPNAVRDDDTLGIADSLTVVKTSTVSDSGFGLTDPAPTVVKTGSGTNHTRSLTDDARPTDTRAITARFVITDKADATDTRAASVTKGVIDNLGLTDFRSVASRPSKTDKADLTDPMAIGRTVVITDAEGLTDFRSQLSYTAAFRTPQDTVGIADSLSVQITTTKSESGVGITDTPSKTLRKGITDDEGLTDFRSVSLTTAGVSHTRGQFDTVGIADSLNVVVTVRSADSGMVLKDPTIITIYSNPGVGRSQIDEMLIADSLSVLIGEQVSDSGMTLEDSGGSSAVTDVQTDSEGLTGTPNSYLPIFSKTDKMDMTDPISVRITRRPTDNPEEMFDEVFIHLTRGVTDNMGTTDFRGVSIPVVITNEMALRDYASALIPGAVLFKSIGLTDDIRIHLTRGVTDTLSTRDAPLTWTKNAPTNRSISLFDTVDIRDSTLIGWPTRVATDVDDESLSDEVSVRHRAFMYRLLPVYHPGGAIGINEPFIHFKSRSQCYSLLVYGTEVTAVRYPSQEQVESATSVYMGGVEHLLTPEEADILIAAGFEEYLEPFYAVQEELV